MLDLFYKSKRGLLGVRGSCKECCASYAKKYANTEQGKQCRAEANAKYRKTTKGKKIPRIVTGKPLLLL